MADYYDRRPQAQTQSAAPASPGNVPSILAEDEEPSTFESLFRFLGRPAFVVRGALTGDFEGVARNLGQFAQEMFNPLGIVNQSLNVTNIFAGVKDLTRKQDRPEFTDMLHRWGAIEDLSTLGPWEKFGLDLGGGMATDPLMLVGGGGEVRGLEGAAKLAAGTAEEASALLHSAIVRGGGEKLQAALKTAEAAQLSTWARNRVLPVVEEPLGTVRTRLPGLNPEQRAAADALHARVGGGVALGPPAPLPTDPIQALEEFKSAITQESSRRVAQGLTPISPEEAARMEASLRGRAANDVFVQVAREEGIDLRKGIGFSPIAPDAERFLGSPNAIEEELQSAFGPGANRRFAMIASGEAATIPDTELGKKVIQQIANGDLIRQPVSGLGRTFDIIYSAKNHMVGERLAGELSGLARPNAAQAEAISAARDAAQGPVMSLARGPGGLSRTLNVLRDLGYDDQWSIPFLRRTFGSSMGEPEALLNSTDEYIRLGNSMPLSIANKGLEALIQRGMSPGGGLTINPLWSDFLGHAAERLTGWKYRNGFVFVPWGDVAQVTAPGLVRRLATEMGWKGPMIADEALGRGATSIVRNIYSRFHFGTPGGMPETLNEKIAAEAETALRDLTATHDGNVAKLGREVAENMVGHTPLPDGTSLPILDKAVREDLGMTQFTKEQLFHEAQVAMKAGRGWDVPTTRAALEEVASHIGSALPNVRTAAKTATGLLEHLTAHERAVADLRQVYQARSALQSEALSAAGDWGQLRGEFQQFINASEAHAVNVVRHQDLGNSLNFMGEAPVDPDMLSHWQQSGRQLRQADDHLTEWLGELRQRAEAAGLKGPRDQWMYDMTEVRNLERGAYNNADRLANQAMDAFNQMRQGEAVLAQFPRTVRAAGEKLLVGRLTRELVDEVAERNPSAPRAAIEKAVAYSHEKMRQIAAYMRYGAKNEAELLAGNPLPRPAWEFMEDANPFYLPHQMDPRLVEAINNPELTSGQRAGIRTVFDMRRNYKTIDEFLTALNEAATAHGVPVEDVSELAQKDYAALTMQRMLAFERTKLRQGAHQALIKLGATSGGKWSVYKAYLDGVLSPVGPRGKNTILGVLAGGTFEIPVKDHGAYADTIASLNRSMDNPSFARGISRGAEHYIRIEWPGLNALYKPMLTSIPTNLRFRFRNLFSNPLQAMFHPDIKFAGLAPMLESVRNDGLVRWGITKFNKWANSNAKVWSQDMGLDSAALHKMDPEQRLAWATQTFVRATQAPSVTERISARNAMGGLVGIKHGPYIFSQVFDVMDKVLGNRDLLQSDLTNGVETVKDFYGIINRPLHNDPNAMGLFVRKFREFVDTGQQWAGELETQWRTLTALQLMEQGKTPLEVVTEVNRLQVDYSRNSEIEGWIRAVVPFARYMVGATGWAADMLRNPSGAGKGIVGHIVSPQFLGTATRSLGGEDTTMAPRYVKESLALPLPWLDKEGNQQFLTSLGFPQEVVIQALSLVGGRPEAVKHVLLGSMQPALKLPAEALMGRSFYFGTDFGSYRKAPYLLQHTPLSTEVPGPNGTTRYEVPGIVNELSNASPTAGIESTINRLGDSRQGMASRLINAVTGFRIQSSDQEAELQRRISDYLRSQTQSGTVGELQVFFQRLKPEDVPEDVKTVLKELEAIRARRRKENAK